MVHLHHGVWIVDGETRWASGEEKTFDDLPQGFGWRYTTKQTWIINHMIHDLVGGSHEVDITYTLEFTDLVHELRSHIAGARQAA